MDVEIGTEAAQFPEKECINGILVAVQYRAQDREFAANCSTGPSYSEY